MGLSNIAAEEWLLVESSYQQRTDHKLAYLANPEMRKHMVLCSPEGVEALKECYDTITHFMCTRYPMCFVPKGDTIHNKIRDERIPLRSTMVKDPELLCEYLARVVEEDVLLLLPNAAGEYKLRAGVMGFAAGFAPSSMFNNTLDQIHGAVPRYRTKLQKPMARFFDRVKVGMFVNRFNWNVQPHNKLTYFGSGKNEEKDGRSQVLEASQLDFNREVFLRSERQCLTRLPHSGAVVFTTRTYTTPLSVVKGEGAGERLIRALEGMPEDVATYKGRPRIQNAVVDFMSGLSDGCDKPWINGFA